VAPTYEKHMLVAASSPDALPFQPGYVLATRYRLVNLLGRGRGGEVWRADDLVLLTPVALKVVRPTSDRDRLRILADIRSARQLTHPAICRVFDVGETQGWIYYSMEFVAGEDLGTLSRRAGRLPSEKVLEIGLQLCGALDVAHGQRLLHRDLRPASVLVDDDGSIRITDFGFAGLEHEPAVADAASPYLAPEQRDGGMATVRSDIFAVSVILYELLVGERPFKAWPPRRNEPRKPSSMVPDVDPALERAILDGLTISSRHRPASAAVMAERLAPPSSTRPSRVPAWLPVVALAVAIGGLVVWLASILPTPMQPLDERDMIVLADVQNSTGEPVFDGALKVALAVAFEQSPFLKVFPDARVRETLGLMQQPTDSRITRALARDIARREQIDAVVAGSIGLLGSRYVLALEVISASTGDIMAREQIEVAAKEDVLRALGDATSRLREKLGESLGSVARFDAPLARATTPSLEALHAYSQALDQGRIIPRVEAIPHLLRAIELDPEFAMAHALLSGVYKDTGRPSDAPVHARQAFALRERVSERERYFISWRYYLDATQAWDQALDLARSWTRTYPREAFAFNSLGLASAVFGRHADAIAAYREAIRLDFGFVPPHGNLARALIATNRLADVKALLAEAEQRGIEFVSLRRMAYTVAFMEGDDAAMQRELALVRTTPDAVLASLWEARAALFAGRFQAAHDHFRTGVSDAERRALGELAAQWTAEDAEGHALAGQCAEARRQAGAALQLNRDNVTFERAARAHALCGDAEPAAGLLLELARAYPEATLVGRVHGPVTEAMLALQRREARRALELLEPVRQYEHAPSAEFWPAYLRGQAHLAAGEPLQATAQFQSILDHRGESPTSPLYALAQRGVGRAAMMAGDTAAARRAYDAFFVTWKDADSGLPALREARGEYARLK
jgi:eukaryotic-like serine/threonine-protein kinase